MTCKYLADLLAGGLAAPTDREEAARLYKQAVADDFLPPYHRFEACQALARLYAGELHDETQAAYWQKAAQVADEDTKRR